MNIDSALKRHLSLLTLPHFTRLYNH